MQEELRQEDSKKPVALSSQEKIGNLLSMSAVIIKGTDARKNLIGRLTTELEYDMRVREKQTRLILRVYLNDR